jgi:hypothetical protein
MSTQTCPFCNAAVDPEWQYGNVAWFKCGTMVRRDQINRADQTRTCVEDEVGMLTDQRDQLLQKVQRLEKAGDFGYCALGFADDDIREHLQVANYNLHGLLNTGEKIQRPNPPQTIHQEGIDASCRVRSLIAESRRMWNQAKETKP